MRLSLRLTLVFSFFGLAIAAGLIYQHMRVIRQDAYERAENMAQATSSAVRTLVAVQARSGRFREISLNLNEMIRQAGIAAVVIRDRKGKTLLSRVDDSRFLGRKTHPGVPIHLVPDGVYDVEMEVSLGTKAKRGTVVVGFHTADLEARLAVVEARAVQWGVTAFLGIALAAWLMGAWFGLRIERLVPRIEALPRNPERFKPISIGNSSDEVGRLVAAFNRLGASLKEETLRRREAELEKKELSAMLIHDLKTPLTVVRSGITLISEIVGESSLASSCKRTLELLNMSTDRLQRMVEDVLQLSRMEEISGLRELKPVDLKDMMSSCAKDFGLVAADRGQKLALEAPDDIDAVVLGDGQLLRRVLDNLVHNAVEHTPAKGRIVMRLSVSGHEAKVSVSDAGPGIPVEARPEIFKKFFQKNMKRHVGNVGLGLALCLKAIERHGGTIGVEDAHPRGACFYFCLPLAREARNA